MSVVSLAEAQSFTGSTDSLLQMFLDAAEDLVTDYVGSPLAPTSVTERADGRGTTVLRFTRVSGAATVTDDAGTVLTGYEVTESGLLTGYGYGRVTVTYTAGFAALPAAVRLAVLYAVQHAVESQRGAVPVSFQAGADESFVTSRGFFLPNRSKELLEPYRSAPGVA